MGLEGLVSAFWLPLSLRVLALGEVNRYVVSGPVGRPTARRGRHPGRGSQPSLQMTAAHLEAAGCWGHLLHSNRLLMHSRYFNGRSWSPVSLQLPSQVPF